LAKEQDQDYSTAEYSSESEKEKLLWFSSVGGNSKKLRFVSNTRGSFDCSRLD